jgi:hypothetical protein
MINARRRQRLTASVATVAAAALPVPAVAAVRKKTPASRTALALTPPMGCNSGNSFATTINEAQARENARVMALKLLPSGYRRHARPADQSGSARGKPEESPEPAAARRPRHGARANDTKSVYCLALFNTEDMPVAIAFDLSHLNLGDKTVALRDLWTRRGLPAARGVIRQTIKPHGAVLLSLSA